MKEFIDKLIERLEEEKKYCSYNPQIRDEAINKSISIVNELAEEYKVSEMPTGWIPCSERLPEENVLDNEYVEPSDAVLVFTKYNSYKVSRYWGNRRNKRDYYDWVDINYRVNEVIAWQPLPAPYTEGE
jgi:hypothetical protein